MNEFFEIAYAASSSRLCLFTGTGFSKAITNNGAPSWQYLLECMCDLTEFPQQLKRALFPEADENPLSLEEAAQIISIELLKKDIRIHYQIAELIKGIQLIGDNSAISTFLNNQELEVVTTNYDKLVEVLAGPANCHSLTPGMPIPRSKARMKVYHIHGSVDSPENMVVTSDDYFRFINSESYFSRKLSTVLHENVVVILGYSLGDTNLKAIINEYKGFSKHHLLGSNLFLISRSRVNSHVKDYYSHCYGIRVLDRIEVHNFFERLNAAIPEAQKCADASISNIRKVIYENHSFTKKYLEVENSFYEIISSLAAIGLSVKYAQVVAALDEVIKTKIELTYVNNAWEQYEHLARWLIYLATILELEGTAIKSTFLDASLISMNSMRRELYVGYSWHAYTAWSNGWSRIIAGNRALIRKHIEANTILPDALAVVRGN